MRARIGVIYIFLFFIAFNASAGKRFWIGSSSKEWNNSSNWSLTSGGIGGATVPGVSDTVYFDSNGHSCNLSSNTTVKLLYLTPSYSDTLRPLTFSFTSSSGMKIRGGYMLCDSSAITSTGPFLLANGYYTSTKANLTINGNFTDSLSRFAHNNGNVTFSNDITISGKSIFYKLTFTTTSTYLHDAFTITDTLVALNEFRNSGSYDLDINGGVIKCFGDLYVKNSGIASGGSGTILICGNSNQILEGNTLVARGMLPNIIIDKPNDTLFLKQNIPVMENWSYLSGAVNADKYNSTVIFVDDGNISGNLTLNTVRFAVYGSSVIRNLNGSTITILDSLIYSGNSGIQLNNGTLDLHGNVHLACTGSAFGGGTGTLKFIGSTDQIVNCVGFTSSAYYPNRLPNVIVNKPVGVKVILKGTVTLAGQLSRLSGGIDATTNSPIFFMTGGSSLTNNDFPLHTLWVGNGTVSIPSTASLVVMSEFRYTGSSAVVVNGGTISCKGNITISNTAFTNTVGSATIAIDGDENQILSSRAISNGGLLPHVKINKTNGTLTLEGIISLNGSWNYLQGNVDAVTTASTVVFCKSSSVNASYEDLSMSFYNLHVRNGGVTLTATSDLRIFGDLQVLNSPCVFSSSHKVELYKNLRVVGTCNISGDLHLLGSQRQTITKTTEGSAQTLTKLVINKPLENVQLNSPTIITSNLTLTKGSIRSTSSNILTLNDNATIIGGSDSSFVYGPLKKIGNEAFVFPLSDTVLTSDNYHALQITAPTSVTDAFVAEYFATTPSNLALLDDSLDHLRDCENWSLLRTSGTSNVTVTLHWNSNSCNTTNSDLYRVSFWDGSKWADLRRNGSTNNGRTGSVSAKLTSSFSVNPTNFALANRKCYLSAGHSTSICSGQSTTLTASGATTYSWSPSSGLNATTGTSVEANPSSTTTYTVTGTTTPTGCPQYAGVIVTVNDLPVITITPLSPTICLGASIEMAASGADIYVWTPSSGLGSTTDPAVLANPSVTTTYTVTGTEVRFGCSNSTTTIINVNRGPDINVSPSSYTLCEGSGILLEASGPAGIDYKWSPSSGLSTTSGASVTASPTVTVTYTLTGEDVANTCTTEVYSVITLNEAPDVSVEPKTITICENNTIQLIGKNADSYSWNPTANYDPNNSYEAFVSPSVTTTYTVTGTNAVTGCTALYEAVINVKVSDLASGQISSNQQICYGYSPNQFNNTQLPAGGSGSFYVYNWESSPDNSTWSVVGGYNYNPNTAINYQSTQIYASTYFRRKEISPGCGFVYSNSVYVAVDAMINPGVIGPAQQVCVGSIPVQLTELIPASGGNLTFSYQWQSSEDGNTWTNIAGATGTTYSPGAASVSTYYRRVVTSNSCPVNGEEIFIEVVPVVADGTLGNILYPSCTAGITENLQYNSGPIGGNGTYVYQWQSSSDNVNWGDIAGATAFSYSPVTGTSLVYYRRKVTSASCSANTNAVTSGSNVVTPGEIGSDQTICYNASPQTLSSVSPASVPVGTISYQWQSSTDQILWVDIPGATAVDHSPGTHTATTYYRRNSSTTDCENIGSNIITITVIPEVSLLPYNSVNIFDPAFALFGGTPAGGTYSGTGVTSNEFDPAAAGEGEHTITYSVSLNGCTGTVTQNILVINPPVYNYTGAPTSGISFNNYGVYVNIHSDQNLVPPMDITSMNIVGHLLNEKASVVRSYDNSKDGIFRNYGAIYLTKDWTNNAGDLFIPQSGLTEFYGEHQRIGGTSITQFENLTVTGTGIKSQYIDVHVNNILDLTHVELATSDKTLLIVNEDPAAIHRTSGFVSSELLNGKLTRKIKSTVPYLFPVGSSETSLRYRPVVVKNSDAEEVFYNVRMVNKSPDIPMDPAVPGSNHPVLTKYQDVYSVNDKFYHVITKTGTAPASLGIYYHQMMDDQYQSIAQWSNTAVTPTLFTSPAVPYWKNTNNSLGNHIVNSSDPLYTEFAGVNQGAPMDFVAIHDWNDYSDPYFALSKAGFVVNSGETGGFGNPDGTNGTVTVNVSGPCPSGSTCNGGQPLVTNGNNDGSGGGVVTGTPLSGVYCLVYDEGNDNTRIKICWNVDNNGNISNVTVNESGSLTGMNYPLSTELYSIVNGTTLLLKGTPQTIEETCSSPITVTFNSSNSDPLVLRPINNDKVKVTGAVNDPNLKLEIFKKDGTLVTSVTGSAVLDPSGAWDGKIGGSTYPGLYRLELSQTLTGGAVKVFKGQFVVE